MPYPSPGLYPGAGLYPGGGIVPPPKKLVLTDAYIKVGAINLSDHCSQITIKDEADAVDMTTFNKPGYKLYDQGLKDARITATFFQDFDPDSVHYILEPAYESGDTVRIEVRPTSAPVSAANPAAVCITRLMNYNAIQGQVGDAATFDALFVNASPAGLRWTTHLGGLLLAPDLFLAPTISLESDF